MKNKATYTELADGKVGVITLSSPPGNIVDRELLATIRDLTTQLKLCRNLVAIVLTAEGEDFSFGASIQEHLPQKIGPALESLHGVIREFGELPAPTIAAVRGRCLGGGFELVLGCDLILAETTATFACPEIILGVFPPAASALLPRRLGTGPAAELLLTGGEWSGEKAANKGLVTRTAPPGSLEDSLSDWLQDEFLTRSPTGQRYAVQASRRDRMQVLRDDLPVLEALYLEGLMRESAAAEGVEAFLEKRQPDWTKQRG